MARGRHAALALFCASVDGTASALRAVTHQRHGCDVAAPSGPGGIAHVRTPLGWRCPLGTTLRLALDLPEAQAAWLCALGAVYVDRQRAQDPSSPVAGGAYIRAHTVPRRYPTLTADAWRARVLHQCSDFLAVDKPAGVPVHATVDNARETCQAQLEGLLGGQVLCPHRLDVPTRGVLLLARGPEPLRAAQAELRARRVRKVYRALCAPREPGCEALMEGDLVHYLSPGPRSPVAAAAEPQGPGWRLCESRVLAGRPCSVRLGLPPAESLFRAEDFELQLGTGRTHQLRAQLAFEGWPIVGDLEYGGLATEGARGGVGGEAARDGHAPGEEVGGAGPVCTIPRAGLGAFFGLAASSLALQLGGRQYEFSLAGASAGTNEFWGSAAVPSREPEH